jgi:hypothetical protein
MCVLVYPSELSDNLTIFAKLRLLLNLLPVITTWLTHELARLERLDLLSCVMYYQIVLSLV